MGRWASGWTDGQVIRSAGGAPTASRFLLRCDSPRGCEPKWAPPPPTHTAQQQSSNEALRPAWVPPQRPGQPRTGRRTWGQESHEGREARAGSTSAEGCPARGCPPWEARPGCEKRVRNATLSEGFFLFLRGWACAHVKQLSGKVGAHDPRVHGRRPDTEAQGLSHRAPLPHGRQGAESRPSAHRGPSSRENFTTVFAVQKKENVGKRRGLVNT